MVFEEGVLRKAPTLLHRHCVGHHHRSALGPHVASHTLHVARDQLEPCVFVRRPALVRERHPARERRRVVVLVEDHDVVGLPVQAAGEIRDLDLLLATRCVEPPQQRRLGDKVVGNLGEAEAPGVVERDLTADPQDRTAVHRHDLRLDRLVHAGLRIGPIYVHGPADVLLEELLGAQ